MFEILLIPGIFLTFITQQNFISKLKLHEPEKWISLGKPGIFNPGDHFGIMFYILRGKYKESKKKEIIISATAYRLCLGTLLAIVIMYFALPLSFWHG